MIELSAPSLVEWLLTGRCNLRCIHCSTWRSGDVPDGLSTPEALALADRVAELKVFNVILSGGEPFLRDDLAEVCGRLAGQGVNVLIPTNGGLVTPAAARRVVAAGPRMVQVSVDGQNAATHDHIRGVAGSFEAALAAIATLQDAGMPGVGISTTISAKNVEELPAIVDLALRLRVRSLNLRLCLPCGRARQEYAALALAPERYRRVLVDFVRWRDELRDRLELASVEPLLALIDADLAQAESDFSGDEFSGCGAGKTACCVWPDGTVSPCSYNDQAAGNVRQQDLGEIWRTSAVFRTYRDFATLVRGACTACDYKRVCAGGCKSRSWGTYGTVSRPDPMCWLASDPPPGPAEPPGPPPATPRGT